MFLIALWSAYAALWGPLGFVPEVKHGGADSHWYHGDFEPTYHSHFATNAALYDAATKLKVPLELRWLPTPSLEEPAAERILRRWDGVIASPGSPYKSSTGMLRGIEFARTRDWPFMGT